MAQVGVGQALGSRRTISVVEARLGSAAADLLAGSSLALVAAGAVLVAGAQNAPQVAPALAVDADFAGGAVAVEGTGGAAGHVDAYALIAALAGLTVVIDLANRTPGDGPAVSVQTFLAGLALVVGLARRGARARVAELVGFVCAVEPGGASLVRHAGDGAEAVLFGRFDAAVTQAVGVPLTRLPDRSLALSVDFQIAGVTILLLGDVFTAGSRQEA
jgi:hypothetical protein